VLITGACGNLGQMVLRELHGRGISVQAMDLDSPVNRKVARRNPPLYGAMHWGDIRSQDFSQLAREVDAIIHLAALLPPATETAAAVAQAVNVDATLKLIAAIEAAPQPPLLVFPSSVTVFGPQIANATPTLKTAGDPVFASDNYTRHKITIEQRLRQGTIPFCILRVGVSVDARTLAADQATLKKLLQVSPDNPLEYIHPIDVATAIVNCIGNRDAIGKTLLLGGGSSCRITQHDFLAAALDAAGITLPRDMMGKDTYYTHWMDTEESNRILRFQQHTFGDYREEMRQRLRFVRPLVKPLSPLLLYLIRRWLQRTP
jgi:nucleoside-diphosphate-sugar epimerase